MEAAGNFYLFNSHKADMITVQFQSGIKLIPIRYQTNNPYQVLN